jgi:hypothetical protein
MGHITEEHTFITYDKLSTEVTQLTTVRRAEPRKHTRLERATRRERTETTNDPHEHEQSYFPARAETNDRCPARARLAWVLTAGRRRLRCSEPYDPTTHTSNKATERREVLRITRFLRDSLTGGKLCFAPASSPAGSVRRAGLGPFTLGVSI